MRFGEVWLNNADGGASKFRPSEMVSDAIVTVGPENLTPDVATVLASYSECFAQCPKK